MTRHTYTNGTGGGVLVQQVEPRRVAGPRIRRSPPPPARPVFLDWWELTKPEISLLVTISALAGFLFASPEDVAGPLLGWTLAGTVLSAAGVGVLNHWLERGADALMRRTAARPLPSGRVKPAAALAFGVSLALVGIGILLFFVNGLTAFLAALTVALYLGVYTPLKRRTPWNTLVGTIPGGLPAFGGYVAAAGTSGAAAWALFAILVLWQMPHFLALAWMYRKDYARAGFAMLPVVSPDGRSTARQALTFAALLVIAGMVPTLVGAAGWVYFSGTLALGLGFLVPTYAFYRSHSTRDARRVLVGSIFYIPVLVLLILVDRWVV